MHVILIVVIIVTSANRNPAGLSVCGAENGYILSGLKTKRMDTLESTFF